MEDIREQLELAMSAMEAQRETLGDAVVDAALAAFREKWDALSGPGESDSTDKSQPGQVAGAPEAHRFITVLVAGLAETHDAQATTVTPEYLWPRLEAIITRSGGTIVGHIRGGAVIAIFGAQATQPDDAERAVRVARWRRAAGLVAPQSRAVLRDFQRHSRLRRID